jgi:site-specific recombinase XerD
LPDLLDAAGKRDRALLEVLYATGMRAGECAALRLDDIDWRGGEVHVRGKGHRQRVALLGRPALRALRDYLQNARPELLSYEQRKQEKLLGSAVIMAPTVVCEELWISRRGNAMTALALHFTVLSYARRAGIAKKITPHTLRHSCAAHLLQNGADPQVVQELLGHRVLASAQFYLQANEPTKKPGVSSTRRRRIKK